MDSEAEGRDREAEGMDSGGKESKGSEGKRGKSKGCPACASYLAPHQVNMAVLIPVFPALRVTHSMDTEDRVKLDPMGALGSSYVPSRRARA